MRKILLFLLLILNLKAFDFSVDNEIEWQSGVCTQEIYKDNNKDNRLFLLTYSPIFNITSEKLDFNFIPMATHLVSKDKVYNTITNEEYKNNDLFIKSLYVKLHYEKHRFLLGVLSLSYNGYLGYKNDFHERGEGLHTIIDRDILSMMYIYIPNENLELKALYGGSYYNNEVLPVEPEENNLNKDLILISNYRKDKIRFDTNLLLHQSIREDKTIIVSNLVALGIGLVYDDSEYSGNVFYNILNFSYFDYKGESVQDIASQTGYTEAEVENNPTFSLEAKETVGFANLLGIRKDIGYKNYEFFFNIEWFHASDNYVSANLGNIYKGDATDMYYVGNDSYSVTSGYNISENQYIKLVYSYVKFDKLPAIGNTSVKVDVEDHIENTTSYAYTKILWNYKF